MTLDGKIATSMGHSAWVSSAISRQHVFENRARSDAVIVGGQTVRLDNPRLTTRRDSGHMPIRICMSRTLDLQEVCNFPSSSAVDLLLVHSFLKLALFSLLFSSTRQPLLDFEMMLRLF